MKGWTEIKKKKKQQVCKPGSVLYLHKAFVIYLEQMSPFAFSNLPPDIGRATLHASVYMILQPIRRTALNVTTQTGELLPHLFTLTPINRSGYFLLRYSALTNSFPLGNMVLCVARTFLHSRGKSDKPTCYYNAKIEIIFYICLKNICWFISNTYIFK